MLDIKYIKDNVEELRNTISAKKLKVDIDKLLSIDEKRRALISEVEELRSVRNEVSKQIPSLKDEERSVKITEMKVLGDNLSQKEKDLDDVLAEYNAIMVKVPTIMAEDTPLGKDDSENVEVEKWGEIRDFDFPSKSHIELGEDLGLIDLDRGAKVAGYRGYYVKGDGVLLMMGFMMYALQKLASKGYELFIPPTLIKEYALFGSGYFKGGEYDNAVDEIYKVTGKNELDNTSEDKFLVGTAEPSLLAYYSDEVLDEAVLPMKMTGYSQCYRSEIGSYGRDTKGMYRVHEFMKVEQVILCAADTLKANALQEEMLSISKELHKDLGLPYRVLRICSGDLGTGKYKQYDLEAYMPSREGYGETGSSSNFLDWQSRRLNVRYKDSDGQKKFVYMLNNTALPSPRIFIAILENYQNADGSITVPEVLRPFVGKDIIKK